MIERVLVMDLGVVCATFRNEYWRFFELHDEEQLVQVIVPRDLNEQYVVDLDYETDAEREHIIDALLGAGFIQSTTRITQSDD